MSEVVGFGLKPEPTTPLKTLVDYGLQKHLDRSVDGTPCGTILVPYCTHHVVPYYCYCRLEEIGASASKEYSLEKAMDKMKTEWEDTMFTFIPYRDTVSVPDYQLVVT